MNLILYSVLGIYNQFIACLFVLVPFE